MTCWKVADKVQVSLPYGQDGQTVHIATIERIRDTGPVPEFPERNVKVVFDDRAIFGGAGFAWVSPGVLSHLGEVPAEADHRLPVT